jgi:hypothetical protein
MGHIKEPDDVDLEVVNRPLTESEKKLFSDFLKEKKKRKRRVFQKDSTAPKLQA